MALSIQEGPSNCSDLWQSLAPHQDNFSPRQVVCTHGPRQALLGRVQGRVRRVHKMVTSNAAAPQGCGAGRRFCPSLRDRIYVSRDGPRIAPKTPAGRPLQRWCCVARLQNYIIHRNISKTILTARDREGDSKTEGAQQSRTPFCDGATVRASFRPYPEAYIADFSHSRVED